jgi:hypothetical protein
MITEALKPHFKAFLMSSAAINPALPATGTNYRKPKWFDTNTQTFFVWVNLVAIGGK